MSPRPEQPPVFDEDPEPYDHRRALQMLSHAVRMRDHRDPREVTHRFIVCTLGRR